MGKGFLDDMLAIEGLERDDVLKTLIGRWDNSKPSRLEGIAKGLGVLVAYLSVSFLVVFGWGQGGILQLAAVGLGASAVCALYWWQETSSRLQEYSRRLEADWHRAEMDRILGLSEELSRVRTEALDQWWEQHREELEERYLRNRRA